MKVLIELDDGLLSLVDAEAAAAGATRSKTLRELLADALRARAQGRGEEFPEVEPWAPEVIEVSRDESPRCKGPDIISARVVGKTEALILSRPVRTAHEVITCSITDQGLERLRSQYPRGLPCGEVITVRGDEIAYGHERPGQALRVTRESITGENKPVSENKTTSDKVKSVSSIASKAQTVAEERMRDRANETGG